MSPDEFTKQQFISLRAEIGDSTNRIFWLWIIGMALVIIAGYLSTKETGAFAIASIPFMLLGILIAFINEQNNINRAGKYLRDVIEPRISELTGWENWLSATSEFREADRAYFVGFSSFFLAFFAITASLALLKLEFPLSLNRTYFWSMIVAYALTAFCVTVTLIRHWRMSSIL